VAGGVATLISLGNKGSWSWNGELGNWGWRMESEWSRNGVGMDGLGG